MPDLLTGTGLPKTQLEVFGKSSNGGGGAAFGSLGFVTCVGGIQPLGGSSQSSYQRVPGGSDQEATAVAFCLPSTLLIAGREIRRNGRRYIIQPVDDWVEQGGYVRVPLKED